MTSLFQVNVLVNNAGVYQQGFVLDTDFTVLKRTIEVDLLGQVSLTKLVAKHMKENNVKGLIGYVSSIASSGKLLFLSSRGFLVV